MTTLENELKSWKVTLVGGSTAIFDKECTASVWAGKSGKIECINYSDHELDRMGYAQKMALLDDVLDATTQRLCNEFGLDAKSMALALSTVQNRWVMSINTDVV